MWFDPFNENLFGEPLGVWLFVCAVWAAPFVGYRIWEWWVTRRDKRREARSDPPSGGS